MKAVLMVIWCGVMVACGADEVSRVAAQLGSEDAGYAALLGEKTLPEELRGRVSWQDVAAEWSNTGYVYFANPPPDSNAEQLAVTVRGRNVERYRYGLIQRDTWCTEDDLTHEAKVGEAIVLNAQQLGMDGSKVLCALPSKLRDQAIAARSFSMVSWEKNNQSALLLTNLPRQHEHRLQVEVQNSDKQAGFDSYYYKVLSGRVDCSADDSAYREQRISQSLDHHLSEDGWYTLCVTGDYENIRSHQWLHRTTTETKPARLLLSHKEIAFTLGDKRMAELGVWNNGSGTLVWEAVLPSNEDRHDLSWLPYHARSTLSLRADTLLPTYALPWLEMRVEGGWSNVNGKNQHAPHLLNAGELAQGEAQQLLFRLADANNKHASWWPGLDPYTYMPYQYTKVLRFTNLASRFSTDVAITLYIPEMQLGETAVTLTPDNTRQMVEVRNIGRGELRWRMRARHSTEEIGIYALPFSQQGKDEQDNLHGEGVVMIAIDEPFPTTRTQQVLEFSYMGGETIQLPVVFEP